MSVEQDYIMRLTRETLRALKAILLGKKAASEHDNDIQDLKGSDLYQELLLMADHGEINEAENFLYKSLAPSDLFYLEIGLGFYEHINEFSNDFLESHDYSREEIHQGIKSFVSEFGLGGFEQLLE